jgi:hypothetical protein
MYLSDSGQSQLTSCYEPGILPFGSIKGGEILYQLSEYRLLKDSVAL